MKPVKIAVYSAVFGDKDEVRSPVNYQETDDIDYYLITDNPELIPFNYKLIYKEPIFDDITKNARYYKINGLKIFNDYDFVIWHDANLQMVANEMVNIVEHAKNSGVAFFQHSERNCTYDEAIRCIELEKDYPFKILRQMYSYFRAGFKNELGLYETGLFVKNNKFIDTRFLDFWWNEIKLNSRRDQLSLPYSLQKFDINPGIIGDDIRNNKYSIFHYHKHSKYNFLSTNEPKKFYGISKKVAVDMIKVIKKLNN